MAARRSLASRALAFAEAELAAAAGLRDAGDSLPSAFTEDGVATAAGFRKAVSGPAEPLELEEPRLLETAAWSLVPSAFRDEGPPLAARFLPTGTEDAWASRRLYPRAAEVAGFQLTTELIGRTIRAASSSKRRMLQQGSRVEPTELGRICPSK